MIDLLTKHVAADHHHLLDAYRDACDLLSRACDEEDPAELVQAARLRILRGVVDTIIEDVDAFRATMPANWTFDAEHGVTLHDAIAEIEHAVLDGATRADLRATWGV